MTDICTIGPVSITDAHLFDGSTFSFSNSAQSIVSSGSTITTKGQYSEEYNFTIICSNDEALQLKGVVEQGELVWMNTSDLGDNDSLQHKGWVLLTSLNMSEENLGLIQCQIGYVKISDHESEYLTMDYSRGIYDGINLTPGYDITSTVYQLQEDGSDITTNWSGVCRYPASGTNTAATDGAEFDITSASATDGVWQRTWIYCDTKKFTPPFTVDLALDRNSLPGAASYPAQMGVMLSPHLVTSANKEMQYKKNGDYFEVNWALSNASTTFYVNSISYGKTAGVVKSLTSGSSAGTADADFGLRLQFYADGKVRISVDDDATLASPTQIYYGPSNLINYKKGLYLYLFVNNKDSTSFTGSFHYVNVYNEDADTFPNIVCMPYNSTVTTTATGTRAGSDGNIPYYTDPSTELRYLIAKADYYKGSVKLLSTNNTTSTSRQVLSTGIKLTPATTTLENAFTQLTFDADEVIIKGYDGGWQAINKIHFTADIDFIRPLYVSSERVVLQINSTKWTMLRSSPIVTVEHPNEILEYTLRDTYVTGSGTTSAPGAAADIAMTADTDYYMKIHDTASDSYSLVIGKKDPCTIKSDSLPVDNYTGIGWFKKAASGINAADSLIQQWYKQTRTGISMKQII